VPRAAPEVRGEEALPHRIGARSWLDYKEVKIQAGRSYYYEHFRQGATVVPQSCWFVDLIEERRDFVIVATSKRVKVRGKVEREMPPLPVEKEFIYGVLTSAEVMPFCHLPPNLAVLPITPAGNKYRVITREEAQRYARLAGWLKEAEDIWESVRGEKIGKMSLYQRLDHQHGITVQDPKTKFKVVYLTSGTYLAAAIVDVEKVLAENPLLNGIIVESTLYHYGTEIRHNSAGRAPPPFFSALQRFFPFSFFPYSAYFRPQRDSLAKYGNNKAICFYRSHNVTGRFIDGRFENHFGP
jgi:hypothetical protein